MRPHRWQPTRLPRPWDSPGKNTGVGCHFLLQCMKVKSESEATQSCLTLHNPMDCSPPGSSAHGIFQARGLEWGAIHYFSITISPISKLRGVLAQSRNSITMVCYVSPFWFGTRKAKSLSFSGRVGTGQRKEKWHNLKGNNFKYKLRMKTTSDLHVSYIQIGSLGKTQLPADRYYLIFSF